MVTSNLVKALSIVTTSAVLIALAIDKKAEAVSFSDENLWRTAATNSVLEDFEGISIGTQLNSLSNLGISFENLNDGLTFPSVQSSQSPTGGSANSGQNVLVNDIDFELPGRGLISFRPLNTGQAISAIGYWNTGGDDTTILRLFDENNNLIEQIESEFERTFNGIVSSIPAFRVEIDAGTLGNGYFTLDDLQVSTISVSQAVPEPSSILGVLMFSTLCACSMLKRKW